MINKLFIIFLLLHCFESESQSTVQEQADSLYINGNYTKAISLYKLLDEKSNIYDKIAKSYVAIGNYDEALKYYKLGVEANPDDALIKYDYAKLLSKTKKFNDAKIIFNELVYVDYKNPNYHYELGLVLEQLKDSTDMNRYLSAFQLDSTHQKAIYKIAKHHLVKRLHKSSHRYIDIGLSSYQNNVELISLKAQNFYWQEKYPEAIKWFEKLIELGESSEFIHEKLSLSYYHDYEYKKAIEHRKKVLLLNPLDGVSWYVVGTYYLRLSDYLKAEEYITKGLEILDKPLSDEYKTLGTVYNQQKKYKEAIEVLKIAVEEDPTNLSSAFFLARTQDEYYADSASKIGIYENYIKKFPDSPFNSFAKNRIRELKEEEFLKGKIVVDSITKD